MPEPRYRLRLKRIDRVSFVDKGDNPKADVLVWKRASIVKRIVERDGQFCVMSEDGSKTLGCHATQDEAARQLAAVEANKRVGKTAAEYAVGDHVRALVDHMPGMRGMVGTVDEAHAGEPPYYAVLFDGESEPHKWLTEDEVETVGNMEMKGAMPAIVKHESGDNQMATKPFDPTSLSPEGQAAFAEVTKRAETAEAKVAD